MKASLHQGQCEFLVVSELDKEKLKDCFDEVKRFQSNYLSPDNTGAAKSEAGKDKKKNSGVFLNELYNQEEYGSSSCVQMFSNIFNYLKGCCFSNNSAFNYIHCAEYFSCLASAYKDGDFYEAHRDHAKLTVLMWFSSGGTDGGDLVFSDFNTGIKFEHNKIVIFPSHYRHEVTPISTDQEGFVRYCASAFIN